MKGSKGYRRGTRKLQVGPRDRGKVKIGRYLHEFNEEDRVAITIDPSYQAIPNPRFQGKTGRIAGKQGRAYYVRIKDGQMQKEVLVAPEHLSLVK
ncbi:MAG: 50S ribosomal protein L21e [Candidatus Altiarchaeales archaeon IMC4]|nr:MAG: 50S ribosomal protein L21e [Candidatus Altiarchaeales archaeon IMC4]